MVTRQLKSNPLVAYLVIGLIVGLLAGYFTRPETAEIRIGPLSIEVRGDRVARGGGELTSGQMQHIVMVTLIGGLIGLGFGFAVKSGRIRF